MKKKQRTPQEHDNSYKQLFSNPRMVKDLLQGFIPQKWVTQLDFRTLTKVSGHYVSEDLRDREDDIVWKVRRSSQIEFVDKMAKKSATEFKSCF